MRHDTIIVLDFGAQYSQLIARRVRETGVYCEILPYNAPLEKILEKDPKGIILSGGPASVYAPGAPHVDKALFDLPIPILGICYGMQLLSHLLKGKVHKASKREFGLAELKVKDGKGLLAGIPASNNVWMSHGDHVTAVPTGFKILASTDNCRFAAVANEKRRIYGVQFHPEVVHTQKGTKILENFAKKVCGCKPTWSMDSYVKDAIQMIRAQVGKGRVLCGVSGGVDSTVAAALIHRAVGKQLSCVFVNNGVLRMDEAEQVQAMFRKKLKIDLYYANAEGEFLKNLEGVSDPEQKRKIIGRTFIRVFEKSARLLMKKRGGFDFLAQGTLYPDVIESVSVKGPSATIKSHHNVGGLPEDMKFKLVEPLRELFKDEVRALGAKLGIPKDMLWRQPFPGPGLAVRVLGAITREKLEVLRKADAIVIEEIQKAGLYYSIWQSFAVLTPVKTVGVMGDERTYDHVCVIRAVHSTDGMTADWVKLPYDLMGRISNRIINEVRGINRVAYDITSKPPGTIEWE
ncbi:MAG TPA: glutamine-hydrolyzing GMP synthase [bacterium]|nr:glutamine-hydrolyzing GMP synthase [bacterium]